MTLIPRWLKESCDLQVPLPADRMPVETLQQPLRQPARAAVRASPPRLRPKGPVGPDFYRRAGAAVAAGLPRQSAVERLEADKAKYVKSQLALSKQQPLRPPEVKKPLLNPNTPLRPTRKTPVLTNPKAEGVQLDVEHLSNLISDLPDGPQLASTDKSAESKAAILRSPPGRPPCAQQIKERPCPPPRPDCSSPAKVRLKASVPARVEGPGTAGAPAVGTVRRVDVMPQLGPGGNACRPPQIIRQPLQPRPIHSQVPLRPAASHQRLFVQRTAAGCPPLKPLISLSKPDGSSSPAETPALASPPAAFPPPPASPAVTRLSSSSSRKRPSLSRSKSDMSDRYSRAGTELERFFNLCGLDPTDLQELRASSSDIVSLARFRSVSAPGSECGGSNREEEEEEEDAGKSGNPTPYGVSVVERNARVIKWLYGLRQAKENTTNSTNL